MGMERKIVLYIAMSLDGYIAKLNDDLSFLDLVEKDGEDYGYADFISNTDTVIIGRKTYDWITSRVDFPYTDKTTYVITRTPKPNHQGKIVYTNDIVKLVVNLKAADGKQIFCVGGSEIVDMLLNENLIDEMIISIIPILLGDGIKLFKNGIPEQKLTLLSTKQFVTGLVQLHYEFESK